MAEISLKGKKGQQKYTQWVLNKKDLLKPKEKEKVASNMFEQLKANKDKKPMTLFEKLKANKG